MTEIPEHLRKRAEKARADAEADAARRTEIAARQRHPSAQPAVAGADGKVISLPDHLLQRGGVVRNAPPSRTRSVGVYFVGRDPKEALGNHHYAEAFDAIIRRDELNSGGPGFQPYKIFATDVEVQEDDLFEW